MGRRTLLSMLIAISMSIGGAAWAVQDPTDDAGSKAQGLVRDMTGKAVALASDPALTEGERVRRIHTLILSFIDLDRVAKFVLPRRWEAATLDQKADFLKTFEDTQVLIWGRRLRSLSGSSIEIGEAQAEDDGTWQVETRVASSSDQPMGVRWRVRVDGQGTAKVTDVAFKGISMAVTIRDDLASILQANGQSFDALLSTLKARNAAMAARTAEASR